MKKTVHRYGGKRNPEDVVVKSTSHSLVEAPAVDTDDDPGVGEEDVGLAPLEALDVLVSARISLQPRFQLFVLYIL